MVFHRLVDWKLKRKQKEVDVIFHLSSTKFILSKDRQKFKKKKNGF